MFTNGSGRTASFWADLAKVVSYVRFSIDGLEDEPHLPARHAVACIMESVQASSPRRPRRSGFHRLLGTTSTRSEWASRVEARVPAFFPKKTSRFSPPAASAQRGARDGETTT